MTLGLTLGKYAPLHRGHQLIIERAIAENDHTIVVIYDAPEVTPVLLETRAGWIRKLYPSVEVLLAKDGPTVVGNTPEITSLHDAYLRQLLKGRDVTHFYSSEFYGHHVSQALGAIDCRVDDDRKQIPISATTIRRAPYRFRDYLETIVYSDLVTKIVFLGAPSTGKTTIARELAKRLKTKWVPEFGREYWESHHVDRRLTLEQLAEIAVGHREREDQIIANANRYLFVDTDATTTYQFSLDYHGKAHPTVAELADSCRDRYRFCFVCDTDIPYDDTWDRSGEVHRANFQMKIESDLIRRNIDFIKLSGSLQSRVNRVIKSLMSLNS
ncbi:Trifunctional NAD biosynthesis/regulator protein NadR [Roseimaritima multifibrata]|uniref:Trifunctional NAD biosynthesis/regulator protein NadR n=1 Tax=Roseimaritima multifibrata TaxID=1930274 RepID=A0A517MIC0_9BACT|nr:AAA family ATPase [Roseimaritima multifibrata]QDS94639.1 Trifunctional NAD biosynthesis/regulator protein NadR [Roseimaritima multifibrata]